MARLATLSALAAAALLALTPGALVAATPDRPEPGKQGETLDGEAHALAVPYSKGVNVIGHEAIAGRHGNLIMAWAGRCAYIAGGLGIAPSGALITIPHGPTSGVAVIDAGSPQHPRLVNFLADKGAIDATETLHAVVTPTRAVLAAADYGGVEGMSSPKEGWLDIYDVRDCAHPKLMSEVKWPTPTHTITVSPNGKRVYGTVIQPFTGDGGIEVMDISDMAHPRFLGKFPVTRADGSQYVFAPHELSISPDEHRLYVGTIASKGGDLNIGVKLMPPNAEGLGPEAGGIYILDSTDFAAGRADPKLRLIGTVLHGGWHSAVQARIRGKPYLVGAGELGACPGAWPRISDISDAAHPHIVGQFRLAMNHAENCPARNGIESATGGVVGRAGTAASHFNDVDSATHTRLGLFGMIYAGLRIVDLADPANPREIAYFKPGDACMSHVRYVPGARGHAGQIWLACADSGFWIVSLKPGVKGARP